MILTAVVVGARRQTLLDGRATRRQAVRAVRFPGRSTVSAEARVLVVGQLVHRRQLNLLVVEVVRLFPGVAAATVNCDLGFKVHLTGLALIQTVVLVCIRV